MLIGCGSMGTRHASIVARDPRCELLTVDVRPERASALAERLGGRAVDRVPQEVDVAVVATPTTTHAEVAAPLLARGTWCLVEKPLADSLANALRLAHPRCAVGHVERYNPAVRAAGIVRPLRIDGRRVSPPTGRSQDVDVVLDLMIHDLDLVLGWAGPEADVTAIEAYGTEDTAIAHLRMTCGLSASLVASRVADRRERVLHCDGSVVLDLLGGRAFRNGVAIPHEDPRDALTCQWERFVAAVRANEALPDSGVRAVALAERIRTRFREAPALDLAEIR